MYILMVIFFNNNAIITSKRRRDGGFDVIMTLLLRCVPTGWCNDRSEYHTYTLSYHLRPSYWLEERFRVEFIYRYPIAS